MMIVIDASVWVSRLVPQDIHYEASYRWLKGLEADGALLIAPILLLSEVAGAISRRTGETGLGRRAIDQLLRIPTLRIASIDHRLGQEAAILAAELSLRGADAAYIAVARRLNIPLVTWDREQQEKGARVIAVRTPEP